ncbi:two-component system sensor histidine kinase NtrB [Nannocystaceae bacterium ST9]
MALQALGSDSRRDSDIQLLLDVALEQVEELVMLVDRSGRIAWVNEAIETTTGWPADEVRGRRTTDTGLRQRLGRLQDEIARCLVNGRPWSGVVHAREPEGSERMLGCRVSPVRDQSGALIGALTFARDETELRRLRAIAEGVNLAENIGQVFAGIRHELGNPINSLKIALTVLRGNWSRFEQARVDEYLERMLGEVARVEYLLRSFRSFSALEELTIERVDASEILAQIQTFARGSAKSSAVELRVEIEPGLALAGDARALYQALLNLMSNALDAVAGRPAATITLRAARQGPWIALEVIDDGPGIEPSLRASVLRPFVTTKREGSGLGLAIAQRLAAGMKGVLELDDRPGGGTIARLLLSPWSEAPERS